MITRMPVGWPGRRSIVVSLKAGARTCLQSLAIAAVLAVGSTALAQTQPGDLPGLLQRLASNDAATRAAAQGELDHYTSQDLDPLRKAQARETDPEVKRRLATRIDQLEVYAVLHPKPLSVDLKNADYSELEEVINKQLGGPMLDIQEVRARGGPRITLKAENLPLWEILEKVQETASVRALSPLPVHTEQVIQLQEKLAALDPFRLQVFDGIALRPAIGLEGADWKLGCAVSMDPRVRLTSFNRTLRVDRLVDNMGRVFDPLPPTKPPTVQVQAGNQISHFSVSASFGATGALSNLREIHGTILAEVVMDREVITVDLLNEGDRLIDTVAGRMTLTKDDQGDFLFKIDQAFAPDWVGKQIQLRTFTKGGYPLTRDALYAAPYTMTIPAGPRRPGRIAAQGPDPAAQLNQAATLEAYIVKRTRAGEIPIVITNPEQPAGAPAP